MYDVWLEALEGKEFAGVCFLDMSAAFDIVDHSLLIQKLELYGCDSTLTQWIQSYLSDRKQCVSIDGSLSKLLSVKYGVPQGSILGPLLYTIFTNELPEVIHDHPDSSEAESWPSYSMSCKKCGALSCYADDTSYSCADSDPAQLSEKLSAKFNTISNFMISNKLKLNDEKTHLMVLTTSEKRRKGDPNNLVKLTTPKKSLILPLVRNC